MHIFPKFEKRVSESPLTLLSQSSVLGELREHVTPSSFPAWKDERRQQLTPEWLDASRHVLRAQHCPQQLSFHVHRFYCEKSEFRTEKSEEIFLAVIFKELAYFITLSKVLSKASNLLMVSPNIL